MMAHLNRHSGAEQSEEPGIHNHGTFYDAPLCHIETMVVMDSGLAPLARPGMTACAKIPQPESKVR